jgi:hypothetical protein
MLDISSRSHYHYLTAVKRHSHNLMAEKRDRMRTEIIHLLDNRCSSATRVFSEAFIFMFYQNLLFVCYCGFTKPELLF